MTDIAVNNSTVRISVESDQDLKRIVENYGQYIAIIHHDNGTCLLVYDSCTLLRDVVNQCLDVTPHWRPRLSADHPRIQR